MNELLSLVKKDPAIKCIYLHMHVINTIGKKFYEGFGFYVAETIEDYYTDIEPKGCYILKKDL